MKAVIVALAVILLAGCAIVPLGPYHDHGYGHSGYSGRHGSYDGHRGYDRRPSGNHYGHGYGGRGY